MLNRPVMFGRMFICIYVGIYVCMYVVAIVATPFQPQMRNFVTTFLIWLPKNGFLNCVFFFGQNYAKPKELGI